MGEDMFKLLTAGVSFDKKRFRHDAERFGLVGQKDFSDENERSQVKTLESDANPADVNRFRKVHRIHAAGSDVPAPIETWQQLAKRGMPDAVVQTISSRYPRPTPIQMQAIPLLMTDREVIASAPTGSGKTAAYLIPLLHRILTQKPESKKKIRTLVLCPTRELAVQIHRETLALAGSAGIRAAVLDKVTPGALEKLHLGADVLVTVPNRLVYLLKEGSVKLDQVEWLVVDESDKLFEAGERGFREQLGVIYRSCGGRKALFSATLAQDVQDWCQMNLDNPVRVTIGERNTATKSVEQKLVYAGSEKGKLLAFRQLVLDGEMTPPVLVFVQSKERAKDLYNELNKDKTLKVDVIHSERSQLQRDTAVRAFRAGQAWILICTELLGRGIDFKGVNLVVNYDFPPSTVSYIHRIGRTGRADKRGRAVTFFTDADKTLLRSIAHVVKSSGSPVPEYMLSLKKATRQEKRKLAKQAVKRDAISKESKYDREKRLKLEAMIRGSKNRQRRAQVIAKRKAEQEAESATTTSKKSKKKKKKVTKK